MSEPDPQGGGQSPEASSPRQPKPAPPAGKPVRISLPPKPKESIALPAEAEGASRPLLKPAPPGKPVSVAFRPTWTIIIPTRPGDARPLALTAAGRLDFPRDELEIIVARGTQPSVQRNTALREAKGELIYFLDDDSLPDPANLQRALQHFANPRVVMVGGPNLCPPDAPALEQAFAATMGNKLAFGPSAARYACLGGVRETSEKELILCNLAARKAALLERGGFDEALYPNEENALMDDLQKRGGKLIYDPAFVVRRRPRATVKAFVKMLMTYGRGRAEQFRLHPTFGSMPNFVPPAFVVYLLALAFLPGWAAWPLAGYALIVLAAAGFRLFTVAPLIVTTHIFYGLGFWRGLFTPLRRGIPRTDVEVTLERICLE